MTSAPSPHTKPRPSGAATEKSRAKDVSEPTSSSTPLSSVKGQPNGKDESNAKHTRGSSNGTTSVKVVKTSSPSAVKVQSSNTPSKKRKFQSAFRIKVGCLVALRYRPEGNDVRTEAATEAAETPELLPQVETWIDPTPGIDEGYMLMGQRVRCCFPKSVLQSNEVKSRIVEGDIVGLVDLECSIASLQESRRTRSSGGYIPVDLLVDADTVLPFLERVDDAVDVATLSDKDRKRHRYEEIIRGKNKKIVRVNLADVAATKGGGDDKLLLCKWVLRKRVAVARTMKPPASTPNGEKEDNDTRMSKSKQQSKTLPKQYVGNKHDSDAQQEQNWRWLARRRLGDTTTSALSRNNLLGEVLSVMPSSNSDTLAMVTVKPLVLPETTERGRLYSQSPLELYESESKQSVQVPVEQLVIASRKITEGAIKEGEGFASVSRQFSGSKNSWTKGKQEAENGEALENAESDILICHRCGVEGGEMLKDHIAATPESISCADCLDASKKFGKSGTFLKSCRCQQCEGSHASLLTAAFEQSMEKKTRNESTEEASEQQCSMCFLRCKSGISCKDCGVIMHKRCAKFVRFVESEKGEELTSNRCRVCRDSDQDSTNDADDLSSALSLLKAMRFTDFDLPASYSTLHLTQVSADKIITAAKPRGNYQRKKTARTPQKKRARSPAAPKPLVKGEGSAKKPRTEAGRDPYGSNKFTCSRLLPYDPIKRRFEGIAKHTTDSGTSVRFNDVIRNWRAVESEKQQEKKTASRAARANQRRMMKDVFAFGSTSLELDALAGRESHLRFDRSGIHAWGVFADQEIREGELLVEYRGEIIGNAMAEKREKEYEQAKIGSDYMFRIDGNSVCDATKQGNVARFINASCDPNCYTQIISISNTKRIVIYAKKDIQAGEELCYDYKFPLEYDSDQRIPCHCSAKDCRGFMNWDKRYVTIPLPKLNLDEKRQSSSFKSAAASETPVTLPDSAS